MEQYDEIIEYLSQGVERSPEDIQKIQDFCKNWQEAEGLTAEEMNDLVRTAPFFYTKSMGIPDILVSFDDYRFAGEPSVFETGINEGKNSIAFHRNTTGLTEVHYLEHDDNKDTTLRVDYYFQGMLLAEESQRSVSGKELKDFVVYTNNPLSAKYQDYVEKLQDKDIQLIYSSNSFSDKYYPGERELLEDFREAYRRLNIDLKTLTDAPVEIYDSEGTEVIGAITVEDAYRALQEVKEALPDDVKSIMRYADENQLVHQIMDMSRSEVYDYLEDCDAQSPLESPEEVMRTVHTYLNDYATHDIVADFRKKVSFNLSLALDEHYDPDRAMRASYLKENIEPITKVTYATRYKAINAGLYALAFQSYDAVRGEKPMHSLNETTKNMAEAFEHLKKRVLVSTLTNDTCTSEQFMAMCLAGPNEMSKPTFDVEATVKDYRYFRDKMLPALTKIADESRFTDSPDENLQVRHQLIKEYTETFVSACQVMKTPLFKKPCDEFCKNVTECMENDPALKHYMKTGKEPAKANTNQR